MLIIGLTGSIGMGKSTAAAHLKALGIAVFDADACVHGLYGPGGAAVPLIEATFPGSTEAGAVNRSRLAQELGTSDNAFKQLETIVHPLVRQAERTFLAHESAAAASYAVLEIPLLYETGADTLVDAVIVVSTNAATQRERVLARPGMTAARLDAILARQLSDAQKRARADFIVDTGGTITDTHAQIEQILFACEARKSFAYSRHWNAAS